MNFSENLTKKINTLAQRRCSVKIGSVNFDSKYILAPLAGITLSPFRQLMEELGAGGTVSELISCHGINYKNEQTLKMLKIGKEEKNIGLQLFGEEPNVLAQAAELAQSFGAKFIDLNMGCPVKKVVGKGGGAALMQDPLKAMQIIQAVKSKISIPLTIKIRTGWNEEQKNAREFVKIAFENGVSFVTIHGRTRAQAYTGLADWNEIEAIAKESPLPIIGNGDLLSGEQLATKAIESNCTGFMVGRGALKNPFMFLEAEKVPNDSIQFSLHDRYEVLQRLLFLMGQDDRFNEQFTLIQLKKHAVWMATGISGASHFRAEIFASSEKSKILNLIEQFYSK